ncbi:hypothetical protein [Kribbella sp. C-35]|uniref:hypothetical protein n=1 Tax=Kribbella sp. C-35 TaxID=2789276 RepID=UPI003978BD63
MTENFTDAAELGYAIPDPSTRAKALMLVAHGAVDAGQPAAAAEVVHHAQRAVERVNGGYGQDSLFVDLAALLAFMKQPSEAQRFVGRIKHPALRVDAHLAVAAALLDGGESDRALTVLDAAEQGMSDPDRHARGLIDLAGALARSGRHSDAERLVEKLTDPGRRARALTELALVLGEVGQSERSAASAEAAERSVAALNQIRARAQTTAEQASKLAGLGANDVAKRMIVAAWSLGDWSTPLDAIAKVDGSVLLTLTGLELPEKTAPS